MMKRLYILILIFLTLSSLGLANDSNEQDFNGSGPAKEAPAGFSLMCYRCQKKPPVVVVEPEVRCHGSEEGACFDDTCPANQECEEYSEKSDVNQSTYYCHNCNDKNACGIHDAFSDPSCDGKCPEGDTCESVNLDKGTGDVVPEGQTREKGTTIPCYVCKPPYVTPLTCSEEGYFNEPTCDGKCSAEDCIGEQVDNTTHQVVPSGKAVYPNSVHWCYSCKPHEVVTPPPFCAKEDMFDNPDCNNDCQSGSDCVAVTINTNTHTVLGPDQTTTDPVVTCYVCRPHYLAKIVCPAGSVEGSCPSACSSDQDCVSVSNGCSQCNPRPMTTAKNHCDVGDEGGCSPNPCPDDQECKLVSKKSNGAAYDCHLCNEKPKIAVNFCPQGAQLGQCPATCGSMDECIQLPGQCYQCKTHSIVSQPVMCSTFGYYNDSSCGGKCDPYDCVSDIIDSSNGASLPWYASTAHAPMKCYYCAPNWKEEKQACNNADYYYDDFCMDDCPEDACDEYYIDKTTGKQVHPPFNTKDVYICYDCIPYEQWVKRVKKYYYWYMFWENPPERFVLNRTSAAQSVFTTSSVMALAKVDPATGQVANVNGDLKAITSFVGGLNTGFGPGGFATTGQVSMDQLSNDLENSLKSGGDYGGSCFNNVLNQADQQAASAGTPTSQNIGDGKMNNQDRGSEEKAYSPDQINTSEDAGTPAASGPVIACGTQNGNKVLQVLDGSGDLIGSITQAMLKGDPLIIWKKLAIAQSWTDKIMEKAKQQIFDQPMSPAQNNNQGNIVPNDPFYPKPKAAKKSSSFFFGLIGGGDNSNIPINADGGMQSQTADMVNNGDGVSDQYYLPMIGYKPLSDPDSAWNALDATQRNVVVALVDSGLDLSHPDGPQYLWTDPKTGRHGWNFVNENDDLTDYRGHGTFVAGIIAAKFNNGTGIAGIDPGAVIMPLKVTDDKGKTNSLAIYRGINFAVDHGARIINVSLGGVTISKLEQLAIARANAKGVLVVIAAGNTSKNLMEFGPSSSPYALAVGMTDMGGKERSLVSSWGPNLGLVAPGEKIISLCSKDAKDVLPSIRKYGYLKESGTSFTTPMVTATASLILAKDPQLTNQQIADIIRSTATPMGEGNWNDKTGFGFLNAAAALRAGVTQGVIAMITNIHINYDTRDRMSSVDVYGTVRGDFKQFTLEAARNGGDSFRQVAGPFQTPYDYRLIARLDIRKVLYGSKEWRFRIRVIGNDGKEYTAVASFNFPDK